MKVPTNNKIINAGFAVILAVAISSCDGRAGFSPPDELATGVYTGSFAAVVNGIPTMLPVFGAISENNELQLLAPGNGVHIAGPVTVSQTKFDARLDSFSGEAGRFFGIDGVERIILDGHLTEGVGANGDFSAPGVLGTFDLTYDLVSGEMSSLDLTAGVWNTADGGYANTITIDATGQTSGTDSNGCVFTGQVTVINEDHNVYQVTLVVANCGLNNGDYSGLAFLSSAGGIELDTLTLGASNDQSAYSAVFQKM